jgi:hypothetical protein
MRKFYLQRHEDVSGNSGTGLVAEGVIFDDGSGAFTWLSKQKTVTVFLKVADIAKLHGHNGRTDVIIEGSKKFNQCNAEAQDLKVKARNERKAKLKKSQNETKE